MNINETDPLLTGDSSRNPSLLFNEENVTPATFDSDEGYSSESSSESERYGNPITFSYGVPVTTPLRGNNMASPPAVERGISTGLSNRNDNDPEDLASRMEEMSDEWVWWTGDTPDKLGVTPLSVIKKNRELPLFEKDYGAYMPANASNPVWRALIKPLHESTNIEGLTEQLQFSLMYLEDYIRANNLEDITGKSVDEIRTEIGWPIQEVYDHLNSGWRERAGGKRKSKRRLGKSKKAKKGKKSRGRKGKNSKKKRKSRKTKTKKSRQNK